MYQEASQTRKQKTKEVGTLHQKEEDQIIFDPVESLRGKSDWPSRSENRHQYGLNHGKGK